MQTYRKQLFIDPGDYDNCSSWLFGSEYPPEPGNGDVLMKWTVNFNEFPELKGVEVDVKVVNSEHGPWSEAVAFKDGCEFSHTEVEDTLGGEWILWQSPDVQLIVEVIRGHERPHHARYVESFSGDEQTEWEERIAAHLFDNYREGYSEQDAADAGREVLKMILHHFRRDLFIH